MHWSLLIATCLVVLASAAPDSPRLSLKDPSFHDVRIMFRSSKYLEEEWQTFKFNYNKVYKDSMEEIFRKKIFAEHLESIDAHNRLYTKGLTTFKMGINRFSDLEKSEVVKLMTGYKARNPSEVKRSSKLFAPEVNASLADEVDWRPKGYVTPVKDQAACGSCWAFSATGTLEGQHFRKTGKLVSLSEQQLVDCSTDDHGCGGGWPYSALSYIASNEGIDTEESYPYEAVDGTCRYKSSTVGATCTDYVDVPRSESALKEAVAKIGPISVAINAGQSSFHNYRSGVYDDPDCSAYLLNHAVLVVGYGETSNGEEYWLVKNSWGTQWGMDGYIWMSRNKGNQCGISNDATFPEV